MRTQGNWILTLVLAFSAALPALAQDADPAAEPPSTGWRKFGEAAQREALPPASNLTLPAGTWITIRADQPLSSDRNQPGDAFTGTLAQPLVANGRVVARRGQTVGGVVVEAQKAGHVSGTSRLRLELAEISLADGRQLPVKTRLMERRGDTSLGRDATAIGATTGMGAAIGAAAAGGYGAGLGAAAGAVASTIGVLVTRGHATVVYPEMLLTFRLEAPVTVTAEGGEDVYPPVTQNDYDQRPALQPGYQQGTPRPAPYYYGYSYPYYSYYYPPYFWGPSFYFYSGPRFYGRGFYGGGFRGGFHRGGFRHR